MTAAQVLDTISRLPGMSGEANNAVSAYTQVKMIDASRMLVRLETECPTVGIGLLRNHRSKHWHKIVDPMVPRERAFYAEGKKIGARTDQFHLSFKFPSVPRHNYVEWLSRRKNRQTRRRTCMLLLSRAPARRQSGTRSQKLASTARSFRSQQLAYLHDL